jgi:hypothetical protein
MSDDDDMEPMSKRDEIAPDPRSALSAVKRLQVILEETHPDLNAEQIGRLMVILCNRLDEFFKEERG